MIRQLPFVKMHGTGNDFPVLDAIAHPLPAGFDFDTMAQALCDRDIGIGGDGLLLLDRADPDASTRGASVRMRMWNPDGTEDMCGNGLRCIALLAYRRGYTRSEFTVQTPAGLRRATIHDEDLVRVGMGEPVFQPELIATTVTEPVEFSLPVGDVLIPHATTLSTGSTHTIIFMDEPIDEERFQRLSPLIENHPFFPQRTSVMWAHVESEHEVRLRIWERGAGETLACGTGACATAVAAQLTGRCGESVTVHSCGGALQIHWQPGAEIGMTGPAHMVFEGEYSLADTNTTQTGAPQGNDLQTNKK